MTRTTEIILREAEDTLYTARLGLELVKGKDPKPRIAGLRNLVVFGRAVTNVLQNLRSTVGDSFDSWYKSKVDEMRKDQVLTYFYALRSQILKQGTVNTSVSLSLSGNPMALMRKYQAPPGAKGFFMGDSLAGCGWEVQIAEGATEKYYVDVPEKIEGLEMKIDVHLADAPVELKEHNIQKLGEHYLAYLGELVAQAKRVFAKSI